MAPRLALWIVNALYFGGTVFYIKLKVRQQPRLPAPDRVSERLVKAKACLSYQSIVLTIVIVLVALARRARAGGAGVRADDVEGVVSARRAGRIKQIVEPAELGVIEMFIAVLFAVFIIVAF